MRFTLLCLLAQLLQPPSTAALETGIVSAGVSTFAASFSGDYVHPVVIAGIPTHNGDEEIVVRITSIDTRTKTIQFYADPPKRRGHGGQLPSRFEFSLNAREHALR